MQVCAEISNLLGDLECNLVVTFNAVSNNKTGKVVHISYSNASKSLCIYDPQWMVKTSQLHLQTYLRQHL